MCRAHVGKPKPKSRARSSAEKPGSKKHQARLALKKRPRERGPRPAPRREKAPRTPPGAAGRHKPPPKPVRPHGKPAAAPTPRGPDKPRPRATKLPPVGEPLTKRELEQILTAAAGRGVAGEGSLKGRLVVKEGMPYLHVVGRDKRELVFLLQGPDQEVLP